MRYSPHKYQQYAIDFIIRNPVAAILLDMGMGKTSLTLMAIYRLMYEEFEVSRVLIIAPLRVAKNTWSAEIEKWEQLSGLRYSIVVGTPAQRKKALKADVDIYIINRENLTWLVESSGIPFGFDMVVVDELSSFKSWQSKRFKSFMKVRPLARRVVGLTGTPSSNGLMDLFAEFKVLDMGKRLGRFIGQYRLDYFKPDRMNGPIVYSYKPLPGAEEKIYARISDITMVWSAYMGLPLSLEGAGAVLGLEDQKMTEGKALIRYFCKPCPATKTNGGRTRNLPGHDPEKWDTFKKYNQRDVEVEMAIQHRLSRFPVPDFIWDEYRLDQEINDRGILLDMEVVGNAIRFDAFSRAALMTTMKEDTGLENPNSVQQMKEWLAGKGINTDSLDKKAVIELLKTVPRDVADILRLRQQLAKSSVKKYQAMQASVCADGRARGMFQFYGANRSGRWAGRIIQLQNLPQNHLADLEEARSVVKSGDYEFMSMLYDDVPDTLSQLIRTAFISRPGYRFVVSDFSAIEARVLSNLARETWRTKVFADNGDIYCASASAMFGVTVEKHGQNSHLRQKGKIAELALGYGGSVGALKSMGALEMGLSEEELQPLVDAWRSANQNIVQFWWDVDRAVKDAIKMRTATETHGIRFIYQSGMLFIALPSGRRLSYVKPRIGENRFGGKSVTYEGVGTNKKWERIESYGPKFVENIVQAISRDILMYAMRTLSHCYICGHVHDELIIECSKNADLDAICGQMSRTPEWIPELLLRADGFETPFYKKD